MTFDDFFTSATGWRTCIPFQKNFAEAGALPSLVHVPTGLGKTAMAVVAWLWRRYGAAEGIRAATPRRLIYCLPMRVLVEQTKENAEKWVEKLRRSGRLQEDVPIHVLMGGEKAEDWDILPDGKAIIIGTQDMLLSRALNRGYAAGRARWPMQFGMLHTDCLWVFDEIQLMGPGLATTTQLEAFRHLLGTKDGHGCLSVWMSATMQRDWLNTVDFQERVATLSSLGLTQEDHEHPEVKKRWNAAKPLRSADADISAAGALACTIRKEHRPGTRTIVVLNTVREACRLFDALNDDGKPTGKKGRKTESQPEAQTPSGAKPQLVLLHSRFRPADRKAAVTLATNPPNGPGTIVVSTQVIEAGVDISATTLFTQLAPWASLVQRFGRCNRFGNDENARVFWIELPAAKEKQAAAARPYELEDLNKAREEIVKLKDVGLHSLPGLALPFVHTHVLRRKDLLDLFDTTPDLAGNDIDIDRFIRDAEETDVRVFWRTWPQPHKNDAPPAHEPAPSRQELCAARVRDFRDFAKKQSGKVWRWNFLDGNWERAEFAKVAPGQVYLVHTDAGGYSGKRGWTGEPKDKPTVIALRSMQGENRPDANDADATSHIGVWQTLAEHTDEVCRELETILRALPIDAGDALRHAARWHDRGKTHQVFVNALPADPPKPSEQWAKAPGKWTQYGRRHFRHELAAALALLDPTNKKIPDDLRDLVAYLVAAHHGKVRLSIRSLPDETKPPGKRFARGVWDGDRLPETPLGQGVAAPAETLSLEPMELGLSEEPPFAGQPSWVERIIRLRDRMGPFHLAFLEAVLRAADIRASRAAERRKAAQATGKDEQNA